MVSRGDDLPLDENMIASRLSPLAWRSVTYLVEIKRLNELTPRRYRAPASLCGNNPSSQPRWGRQDSSSEDGRHNGDGSRSSHKDSGSTALADILQWADHFEPSQT